MCRNAVAVVESRVVCTWAAAETSGGFGLVDADDPQQPRPAGTYVAPGFAFGVAADASHAFVVWTTGGPSGPTAPGGLRIVDVSAPEHPQEIGAIEAGPSLDVAVDDGFAFLGTAYNGLRVVDVRDPAAPVEVAAIWSGDGQDRVSRVRLSGDRVYALHRATRPPLDPRLCVLRFAALVGSTD
jgi:hypothetical protein